MSAPTLLKVHALRIAHVKRFKHVVQTINGFWHCNQMNMIRHQAVSQHLDIMLVRIFFEPREVGMTIMISKKNAFAPIAALGDMVRKAGKDCSG
jgi:hypothetical protein